MAAVYIERHGDSGVLTYSDDFPAPKPDPRTNQVEVLVVSAGLNPVDFKLRKFPIPSFAYPVHRIIDLIYYILQLSQIYLLVTHFDVRNLR